MAGGHRRREEDRWVRLATVAAWLLAPHTKSGHTVTAEALLGWPKNWRVARERQAREDAGDEPDGDGEFRPTQPGRGARSRQR